MAKDISAAEQKAEEWENKYKRASAEVGLLSKNLQLQTDLTEEEMAKTATLTNYKKQNDGEIRKLKERLVTLEFEKDEHQRTLLQIKKELGCPDDASNQDITRKIKWLQKAHKNVAAAPQQPLLPLRNIEPINPPLPQTTEGTIYITFMSLTVIVKGNCKSSKYKTLCHACLQ